MSWSKTKQLTIIGTIIGLFLLAISGPIALWLHEPATCYDGIQNADERGIDCGGICSTIRLCSTQVREPTIIWSRTFKVTDGLYNAVAYVENPNPNAESVRVPYTFRLLDKDNIMVTERQGSFIFVNHGIFAIFESGIQTGAREAARAFFEWNAPFVWKSAESPPVPSVVKQSVVETGSPTRIEATIGNDTPKDMFNLDVVVTVFNAEGNAIASSRTILPLLERRSERTVFFTWPNPFPEPAARIDVIPRLPISR